MKVTVHLHNVLIYCTDDSDDGMGLPIQLPPTDYERATVCRCKPRSTPPPTLPPSTPPPPPQITVSFKAVSYSAAESDGSIIFTVQSSVAFSDEFSVEFCTQNATPLSAEGKLNIYVPIHKINALLSSW